MHACDRRTDRQSDRWTEFSSLYRICITCSTVKMPWCGAPAWTRRCSQGPSDTIIISVAFGPRLSFTLRSKHLCNTIIFNYVLPLTSTSTTFYSAFIEAMHGHNAFQILHIHTTVINSGRAHTTQHRTHCWLWTAATILADAAVTPTVSEMT